MQDEVLVLLSGGLDSSACATLAREKPGAKCLFVDYGQAAVKWEQAAANRISHLLSLPLTTVTISSPKKFGAGEISGRNAFLVLTALMFGDIRHGEIILGIHAGTSYYDCTPAFLASVDRIVAEYTDGRVRVAAPFLQQHKHEIVDYLKSTMIPAEATYSCEAGTQVPCGTCLSCRDRKALGC